MWKWISEICYWIANSWKYLALLPTCGQSPVDLSIGIDQSSLVVWAIILLIASNPDLWIDCETLFAHLISANFHRRNFGQFLDPNLIHFSPFSSKVGQWGLRPSWWGPRFSWLVNQSDRGIVLFLKQHFLLEVYSKILQFMLDFRVYD